MQRAMCFERLSLAPQLPLPAVCKPSQVNQTALAVGSTICPIVVKVVTYQSACSAPLAI